jgi:YVTN family beta-propeller protein
MKMSALLLLFGCILSSGCIKNPSGPDTTNQSVPAASGVFVLNEGNYGDVEGGRLSLYVPATDTVYHSLVEGANGGAHLGSTADDFALFRGRLYVLMSGSERLVILSAATYAIEQEAYFPGDAPHSMVIDSVRNVIYITRLFKSSVLIVNLQTLHTEDSVVVGQNPLEMLLAGNRLFVCNSGYGSDNRISVINADARSVESSIAVGFGPSGIVRGSDGMLWVACTGNAYSVPASPGAVYRINPGTKAIADSVKFAEPLGGTIAASADGYIYFVGTSSSYYGGPIHRIAISSIGVVQNFVQGTFYGIGVDEATGDLFLADAKSFTSAGVVSIYTASGVLKKTFVAERGPSMFIFRR